MKQIKKLSKKQRKMLDRVHIILGVCLIVFGFLMYTEIVDYVFAGLMAFVVSVMGLFAAGIDFIDRNQHFRGYLYFVLGIIGIGALIFTAYFISVVRYF